MAELFDCTPENVLQHLKKIYAEEELTPEATAKKFLVVRKEGARSIRRQIEHYNLDTIIAVGYRSNSRKATRFRQRPTKTLKEYIQKGFVLNDELMKNGRPFGRDYFDELLERIREIRASERRTRQGYPMTLLSTRADESSQHLYRKLGYVDCGGLVLDRTPLDQPMELFFRKIL